MAATRLIALHRNRGKTLLRSLTDRTDYAKNPDKTEKGELVTGYKCDPYTAAEEFLLTKQAYALTTGLSRANDVIAYQIRQSFKPGEVTPEEANAIGRELALRFTKGKHAFIVATHTDRAHIHNHIIFNSTELSGTKKFRNFLRSGLALQRVSDIVCLEHDLSTITPKPYGERTKRTTWPKRDPKLIVDVERKLEEHGKGYANWAARFNIKQLAKSLLYLRDRNIKTFAELETHVADLRMRQEERLENVRALEERLSELKDERNLILDYVKTLDTYREYKKRGSDESFRKEHEEEIERHEKAKRAYEEQKDRPKRKRAEIEEEFSRTLERKREAYREYAASAREAKEASVVLGNIRTILEENHGRDRTIGRDR